MKRSISRADKYLTRKHRHRVWMRIVSALACVVVFCTTYALILPAVTMEKTSEETFEETFEEISEETSEETAVFCNMEEHQHTESCYEQRLICGQTEGQEPAGASTGGLPKEPTGELPEEPTGELPEEPTESLTEETTGELPEEPTESLPEKSTESSEEMSQAVEEKSTEAVEKPTAHVHTEACYETVLVCGYETEHTHTQLCYADPEAEAETAGEGEASSAETLPGESVCGDGTRSEDLTPDGSADIMLAAGSDDIVEGVSPVGSVINLFDYWVTGEGEGQVSSSDSNQQSGINKTHALKFTDNGYGNTGTANRWTGDRGGVLQGIVSGRLTDGYPTLSGTGIFDSGIVNGDNTSGSLAYLFDPATAVEGKRTYAKVSGLLQVDRDGYYYYDSTKNYAEYESETNQFILYDNWKITHNSTRGQFFPFDAYSSVSQDTGVSGTSLNHFFGMTLTTKFVQQFGGHTDATGRTATTFQFSGDDDVWIFIDGVLVADLGGIHDAASVTINFAEGTVTISKVYGGGTDVVTHFSDIFKDTSVRLDEAGKTLPDETYHTMKFFYLERGGYASNLSLKYNLNEYPRTSIYKVNQYGDEVSGATFAVYAADQTYQLLSQKGGSAVTLPGSYGYDGSGNIVDASGTVLANALYMGTTDAKGEMIFSDEDGIPATLKDLEERFGSHFILREIRVPEGYRMVKEEIHLKIEDGLLLCDNSFESGVYSSPNLLISAPNEVGLFQEYEGKKTVELAKEVDGVSVKNGTLFVVVMKYVGTGNPAEDPDQTNWAPVYGTAKSGYTVTRVADPAQMLAQAIETAKKQAEINTAQGLGKSNLFSLAASGAWQANMENLPGDVTKYYNMLGENEKDKTEYTVGYYWTKADSLAGAAVENTYRVNANGLNGLSPQYNFTRAFGASVNVPNLLNRVYAQKFDTENNPVNGAVFALYRVEETDGTVYYVANDSGRTQIYLSPDDGSTAENDSSGDDGIAGNNQGNARLKDGSTGTYRVNPTDGVITVTAGGTDYIISPEDLQTTVGRGDAANPSGEDGTATFSNLTDGSFYLREISAPERYLLNAAEVMVYVTDTSVLANAGGRDDGIVVGRGPGYLVDSLNFAASEGLIDNTLSWVYGVMCTTGESRTFADASRADFYTSWNYIKENYWNGDEDKRVSMTLNEVSRTADTEATTVYLTYDPANSAAGFDYVPNRERAQGQANAAMSRTTGNYARRLYTDVGWSYLEIYQDDEYGRGKISSGTTYQILDEIVDSKDPDEIPDGMIADLFSRSVYIQVTDSGESRLEISKTVADKADDTTRFTFTVEWKDAEGKALTGGYPFTVYETDADGARTPAAGENATGTIRSGGAVTLTDGQVAVIEGLPAGAAYTVTEAGISHYNTAYTVDGGEEKEGCTAAGTLKWQVVDGRPDDTTVVAYTNTYSPLIDFTIRKVKSGKEDMLLGGARFVLYRTGDGVDYYYQDGVFAALAEGQSEEDVAYTTGDGADGDPGIIIFTGIPNGIYYLREIKAPDGYARLEKPITVTVVDGTVRSAIAGTASYKVEASEAGITVTVPNSTGMRLPDTGGRGTDLYTGGGLLIMAGAVMWGIRQRRRRAERLSR